MKSKLLEKLFKDMSCCHNCMNLKNFNGEDCSLINIFINDFYRDIPSIWTDWFNKTDASIMIIGQDWGPYNDMMKFRNEYLKDKTITNWKRIIDEEKSLTKRNLYKFLLESAEKANVVIDKTFFDNFFITNAIMCARKGNRYRDKNICLKKSTVSCSKFLKRQIDIIKPKIILTLGLYPLFSLSNIYDFDIEKKLGDIIKNKHFFKLNDFIIIPLYHPAAQISKEKQLEQYNIIWNYF